MSSIYLYYWHDPYPCLFGSGVLDFYRREYKSYQVYRTVYTPVLVSIEWTKGPYFAGYEKYYAPGEDVEAKIWVTNDTYVDYPAATLTWRVVRGPNGIVESHDVGVTVVRDSSTVAETIRWQVPNDASGRYRIEAGLKAGEGELLSENWFEFMVLPAE